MILYRICVSFFPSFRTEKTIHKGLEISGIGGALESKLALRVPFAISSALRSSA
jgi:hypothetical protein